MPSRADTYERISKLRSLFRQGIWRYTDHVKGFRYFSQFKQYAELEDVLSGRTAGRENDHERILSYNIGLGLHDILFASKIYDSLSAQSPEIKIEREVSKFWI